MKQTKIRKRVQISFPLEEDRTSQAEKNICDINNIVDQYRKTGTFPGKLNQHLQYLDATEVPDLATAMTYVRTAKENFMQYPAQLRAMMDNDPRNFEAFVTDEQNRAVLERYGVVEKPKELPPKVEPVKPADPPPAGKKEEK